ncbi:MAG: pyridoxamine 5'-phosphate oxidase family protein [Alphaproteobacteria bacterium]|nr:pyridoxamine 5'-phosphate oxidase family protein [Alphaproteobacteria bacterium]
MDRTDRVDPFAVTSLEDLREIYAPPRATAIDKETDHVTDPGRAFIAASPFLILATASETGVDCSPKGDAPGFVQLLDDHTILIPDRPGNNRIDGMKNIIDNPNVGIIFMVPGSNWTYRVNGAARISTDPELLGRFEVRGKLPRAVIIVSVEQAFSHCPKAFVRAKLWDADTKNLPDSVPNQGDFAADRDGGDKAYAEKYYEEYLERMKSGLY